MDGCSEIKPRDLLSIKALETITRKYDEYADLAVARDRDPKPFTAEFVKHSTELAMKFNNLILKPFQTTNAVKNAPELGGVGRGQLR
jgi:hypothetical protein